MMNEEIVKLLHEAGNIILSAKDIGKSVKEKEGSVNFVTKFDVQVQKLIEERLLSLYPDAVFMGEEDEERPDAYKGKVFIVDPIDGTTNFIKGCNDSAISIGLLEDGVVILGATYDPYRDELFYAEKGKGAFLNGEPIHVADCGLSDSLVCFGTSPYYEEMIPKTFALAEKLVREAMDLRRSGSAVIDFGRLARGCAGFMFEMRLSPWDYAASSLIITEAGGVISQMDGSPLDFNNPCSVVAGTPKAYKDFFDRKLNLI